MNSLSCRTEDANNDIEDESKAMSKPKILRNLQEQFRRNLLYSSEHTRRTFGRKWSAVVIKFVVRPPGLVHNMAVDSSASV